MHEELNYFGNKNQKSDLIPNKYDLLQTYSYFNSNYNNFSKISLLFYNLYKYYKMYHVSENII